jgi:glyoxylase-like metal-dependent hydrolase (beta-lactamase superfamily II)
MSARTRRSSSRTTRALVVDSEITPAAARALVADLKAVTPKPVRYVVDSHYHYDHAHGNQVFMRDAQVIGHDNTRRRMLGNVLEQFTYCGACSRCRRRSQR